MDSTKQPEQEKKIALLLDDLSSLEEYIHHLFAFTPLSVCFISPLGVILEVNPAFEKTANYKRHELVGESLHKLFSVKDAQWLIKESLENETLQQKELKFFSKGQKEKVILVSTKRREGEKGEAVGFFLGFLDITTLKQTEKELKQTHTALLSILEDTEEARQKAEDEKAKTQAIITNLTDGLLVFNKENELVLMNPQVESFFGIEKEQLIGKHIEELVRSPKFKILVDFLGPKIKKLFRQELEIEKNFFLQISTIPLTSEKTKINTLVILHDISREKVVERLKTEFVSISAHQLRTPLSAIKWTLRMLLDGDLGEITKEQREFLEKTHRSNERMIALINSLLNVTRIEEGRFLNKIALVSIGKIVELIIDRFQERVEKKKISLEFKKAARLPKIFADKEKIELVIQNLIDNAIRYTLPGGKVKVFLTKSGTGIKFKVKDTGVGIPKLQQKRVFSKFFRGANVIRLDTEGTGLGLFIVENVIEAHGGKVEFESEEGKGSCFHFTLPGKKKSKNFKK